MHKYTRIFVFKCENCATTFKTHTKHLQHLYVCVCVCVCVRVRACVRSLIHFLQTDDV